MVAAPHVVGTASRRGLLAALLALLCGSGGCAHAGVELRGADVRRNLPCTSELLKAPLPPRPWAVRSSDNLRGGGLLTKPKQKEEGPPAPQLAAPAPHRSPVPPLQQLLLLRLSALCCCSQGITCILLSEQIEKVVLGAVSRGALTELWGILSLGWGVGQLAAAERLPPQRCMLVNAAPALFALWAWVRSALSKDMLLSWSETLRDSKRSNVAEVALVTWLKKVSAVQFALFLAAYAYYFVLDPAVSGLEARQY